MNEYDWDFSNAKEWGKWTIRKQATLEKINAFIKKTARYVGVEKDRFTLYTFRHSAITHEVEKKNIVKPQHSIIALLRLLCFATH